MRLLLAVVVATTALVAAHDGYRQGWACQACIDAFSTFRAQFGCSGTDPAVRPGAAPLMHSCPYTGTCDVYKDAVKRRACILLNNFIINDDNARTLVATETLKGTSPYDQCVELAKCRAESMACRSHLEDPNCASGPECEFSHASCDDATCEVCFWVVATWPQYRGMCAAVPVGDGEGEGKTTAGSTKAPKKTMRFESKASMGDQLSDLEADEAHLEQLAAGVLKKASPADQLAAMDADEKRLEAKAVAAGFTAFVEACGVRGNRRRPYGPDDARFLAAGEGSGSGGGSGAEPFFERKGLHSPPLAAALDVTARDRSLLMRGCGEFWDWLKHDATARMYVQVLDSLGPYPWDAELACMCAGKCPFDSIEGLGVHSACRLPMSEHDAVEYFFYDLQKPN